MIEQVAFLVFAAITLVAAFGVVAARTVFVSALWLILSFVGVAGLYVLLGAGFLATIQVLVYVGAISVLILFVVMLTRNVMGETQQRNRQWVLATMLALALFGVLAVLSYTTDWPVTDGEVLPASGGALVMGNEADAQGLPGTVAAGEGTGSTAMRVPGPTEALGRSFMTQYLLAFEVVSAILLVALVGAIVIARE